MRTGLIATIVIAAMALSGAALAERVTVEWNHSALDVYETGFTQMCMKAPGDGVRLFDMELIQNDAPGAGRSEKGVTSDVIWGKNRGRKTLVLDDIRARKAFVVFWVYSQGKNPLHFLVNGNEFITENWRDNKSREVYRWVEFPVEWLKKGRNTIEFFAPECATEAEGWNLYIARADEFQQGGGDPTDVGKTSFKSVDGGESWKESPFGPLGQTRAEYTMRISFDRYVKKGWLATPVLDLWKGDSNDFIVRQHIVRRLKISVMSEVPEGAMIEYYIRKGTGPDPFSEDWGPYELIGSGEAVNIDVGDSQENVTWDTISSAYLNRRYIQLRCELSTTNPLNSPVVRTFNVTSELQEPYPVPLHENVKVLDVYNPTIKYSSIPWEWEPWDRPEFEELRKRENTDRLVDASLSEFDAIVKLLDYADKRWRWVSPTPEYPGWDALSIANRIDNLGGGGMCIQFNLFLGGLCIAYGWQSRLVNIVGHEICEVWNDDLAKWVYLDASMVNHYAYDPETCEPLNFLELHRMYLDLYFPDKPIDWMNDFTGTQKY